MTPPLPMPTSSNLALRPLHSHKTRFLSYRNSPDRTKTTTWLLNKTDVNTTSRFSSLFSSNYTSLHSSLSLRSSFCLSYPYLYSLCKSGSPYFRSHLSSMTNSDQNSNSQSPSIKTVRVMIKGRVQGVFYRDWTVENATQLGLKGWVRNRRDGSVEALFSGDPDKVQVMEQRCRRGPPSAMVTGLQVFPCNDDPGNGFERKPTA